MMSSLDEPTLKELLARPKIGIVVRPGIDAEPARRLIDSWAAARDKTVVVLSDDGDAAPEAPDHPSEDPSQYALIIALGGDGTVLRALAEASPRGAPVLGVNLGSLGFLTEVSASQLEPALQLLDKGSATLEARLALDALSIDARGRHKRYLAYNDTVLSRTPGAGPAAIAVHVDRSIFARYACDAIVISTPTGATAYNFAAGGPLVAPSIEAFAITAVAPHGPFNRTLLADASAEITIEILARSAPLELEIDGQRVSTLSAGGGVRLVRAPTRALLLRLSPTTYYERARVRLGLADPEVLREDRRRTRTILADLVPGDPET
jgi:NAD+ kinase